LAFDRFILSRRYPATSYSKARPLRQSILLVKPRELPHRFWDPQRRLGEGAVALRRAITKAAASGSPDSSDAVLDDFKVERLEQI
jgi:hypothetical protein